MDPRLGRRSNGGCNEYGGRVHCGRVFSAAEIADLCATVAWLPGLARKELAATVCEHAFALDWNAMQSNHLPMRLARVFNTLARFTRP